MSGVDFVAGTYPYRKRQAIADAVQAGLLPHMQQDTSDVRLAGEVVVIVRVTPPDTPEHRIDGVPDCVLERMEYWERRDRELGR